MHARKLPQIPIAFTVLSAFTCTWLPATALAQQINVNKDNRTIAITSTDSVRTDADLAIVHIGFQIYAADEKAAYADASERSNAIAAALTQSGVPKASIESENQNVAPVQPFENQNVPDVEKAARRFVASQSWTVRTKPDDAAKVLNTAVNAGANQSGGIDWQMQDESALLAQAAAKALSHARSIADQMAQGLNIRLGPLVYASNEARSEGPVPLQRFAAMAAPMAKTPAPLAINPRKVERSATVYAVFAIE